MSDRELLEMAALAAGIKFNPDSGYAHAGEYGATGQPMLSNWNPLTNDGDALRLAVKCFLMVDCMKYRADVIGYASGACIRRMEEHDADPDTATRRAIVRAAAEIGASMTPAVDATPKPG